MTGKVSSDTITPTRAHVKQSPKENRQSNLQPRDGMQLQTALVQPSIAKTLIQRRRNIPCEHLDGHSLGGKKKRKDPASNANVSVHPHPT